MRLDHVSYAAGHEGLGATVQTLGSRLGASFVDGGLHPRFGTRNFVLPLAGGNYVEVVGRLDHPAADKEPFGQAVTRRTEQGGGWMGWAIAVQDMSRIVEQMGRQPVEGHRYRPDGIELEWQQLGVRNMIADPLHPYFVKWMVDPALHPSAVPAGVTAPGVRIVAMEVAGDPKLVERVVGVLDSIELTWVEPDGDVVSGIQSITFETPHGIVRID